MSKDRQEAIQRLSADIRPLPDGEPFHVGVYQPADGPGVARLFYTVYGDGYPIDTFYIPERLTEENLAGRIRSVVARTDGGQVVSHIAFYRSSPPNPNLYEYGLGLTLPSYRRTLAFARCNQLLLSQVGTGGIDAFYGEAVCNHIVTQKLTRMSKALETALAPALMPAEAYEAEQSAAGRVSCILAFRIVKDNPRTLYFPACYGEALKSLAEGLCLDRRWIPGDDASADGCDGEIEVKRFDFAGAARCTISGSMENLGGRIRELERDLKRDNFALIQFFVDLGKPWSGKIVQQLRQEGFYLGGLLPLWFGDDGLLMQKNYTDPGFDAMQIYSERGRSLRDMVQADWARAGLAR